uniref:Uncharacterized protein n=1 Tax=Anguilla anguilla TaxID=7936 RepID=A0A0E9Q6F2_ANGAN
MNSSSQEYFILAA